MYLFTCLFFQLNINLFKPRNPSDCVKYAKGRRFFGLKAGKCSQYLELKIDILDYPMSHFCRHAFQVGR